MSAEAEVRQFTSTIDGFLGTWNHADKIRFFAWFQHTVLGKPRFVTKDIASCYDALNYDKPNISQFLADMEKRKPKVLLRNGDGYALEGRIRDEFDRRFGSRESTVVVDRLLSDLPGKIPDQAEREFLSEALTCFRNKAFRASVVMTWNLTYFHLCHYILKHKLAEFNTEYPIQFPGIHKKAKAPVIATYEDFSSDLKESEVIRICRAANILTKEQAKALDRQIDRRNTAAHPSTTSITYIQAEEFIHDLITNVVLTISI